MVIVRPYDKSDKPAIHAMYETLKQDYAEPDWGKMLLSSAVEVDGALTMATFLRPTTEAYMLIDPNAGRKRDKLGQILIMQHELVLAARRAGVTDIHTWLPPKIEHNFGKLLMQHLGWAKPLWPCYSREIR